MRYQGKITDWNDAKGFGFVMPNGGGTRAFVHVKSFVRRGRRPVDGDLITYEVTNDSKNRANAVSVRYPGDTASKKQKQTGTRAQYVTVRVFGFIIVAAAFSGKLPFEILLVYVIFGGISFLAYGFDKAAARSGRWRTPENTLHVLSLLGGWPGALMAQNRFRHKTKKEAFRSLFWVTVLANCGILFWLTTADGSRFLQAILKS